MEPKKIYKIPKGKQHMKLLQEIVIKSKFNNY